MLGATFQSVHINSIQTWYLFKSIKLTSDLTRVHVPSVVFQDQGLTLQHFSSDKGCGLLFNPTSYVRAVTMRILQRILILSCIIWVCAGHWQRAMSDETYDVILKALKGELNVPVAQRSRIQSAALVRLWWNRQLYALSEDDNSICLHWSISYLNTLSWKETLCFLFEKSLFKEA